MTRRRLLRSDVRCVAIAASIRLFILREFFFNRDHLGVGRLLIVFVTGRARRDGHIRSQAAHGRRTRNVDVTRRAFQHMLALAALVTELCGNAFRRQQRHKRTRGLVTTGTVAIDGFLIFPVASEARIVAARRRLEELAR